MSNLVHSMAILATADAVHHLLTWVYQQSCGATNGWNYDNEGFHEFTSVRTGLTCRGGHALFLTHSNAVPTDYLGKVLTMGGRLFSRDLEADATTISFSDAGKFRSRELDGEDDPLRRYTALGLLDMELAVEYVRRAGPFANWCEHNVHLLFLSLGRGALRLQMPAVQRALSHVFPGIVNPMEPASRELSRL